MFAKRSLLHVAKRVFSTNTQQVKIVPIKLCSSCKYFNEIGNCMKFTNDKPDMLYGEASYADARDIRRDENACGKDAKHFEYLNHALVKRDAFMVDNTHNLFKGLAIFVGADVGIYLTITYCDGFLATFPFAVCAMLSVSVLSIAGDCHARLTYKYVPTPNPLICETNKNENNPQ